MRQRDLPVCSAHAPKGAHAANLSGYFSKAYVLGKINSFIRVRGRELCEAFILL